MSVGFTSHPKVDRLSDAAFRVHMKAMDHSKAALTRGHVSEGVALGFAYVTDALKCVTECHGRDIGVTDIIDELVEVGVWERAEGGGFLLHDWDQHQNDPPPRTDEQRAKDAERQRRHRMSQNVTPVTEDVSRECHSRSQSLSRSPVSKEKKESKNLDEILAALRSVWPPERNFPSDHNRQAEAIFDADDELPDDLTEAARLYLDAHGFTAGSVDGCPNLSKWIADRRWTAPLPTPKRSRLEQQDDHVARRLKKAGLA